MQHKLATWAESDGTRRFDRLLRLIADRAWLAEVARIVLASRGADTPGIDGIDKQRMQAGLAKELARLRTDLLTGDYRPQPVKRIYIPKANGTIGGVRIRRSAGKHRTKHISAPSRRLRRRQRNAMTERHCEFVDSRLRRCPPDRASAASYGQAGENALRFPHLAHRSAADHKLHSATATSRIEFDSE
jgi:hypothetical protein